MQLGVLGAAAQQSTPKTLLAEVKQPAGGRLLPGALDQPRLGAGTAQSSPTVLLGSAVPAPPFVVAPTVLPALPAAVADTARSSPSVLLAAVAAAPPVVNAPGAAIGLPPAVQAASFGVPKALTADAGAPVGKLTPPGSIDQQRLLQDSTRSTPATLLTVPMPPGGATGLVVASPNAVLPGLQGSPAALLKPSPAPFFNLPPQLIPRQLERPQEPVLNVTVKGAPLVATPGYVATLTGRTWKASSSGRTWVVSAVVRKWTAALTGRVWKTKR